jgi:hypothetical protein
MDPKQVTYEVAHCFLKDHAGAFGDLYQTIEGWLRSRSFQKLASCTSLLESREVLTAPLYKALLQMEAFFKKNSSFTDDTIALNTATAAFFAAEAQCRETNLRLDDFYMDPSENPGMYDVVFKMEQFISAVLGPFEDFLERLPELVRLTSGATKTRSRRMAQPHRKLTYKVACTPKLVPYLSAVYRFFGYRAPRCNIDRFNRVEFVPKNWKTKRTIACEPDGNLPFQLAFDSYVKPFLKYWGCNLSDQSVNQRLAREGSINGWLATIDLSQASDTCALNTVLLLFPEKWASFLLACRSPGYKLGDSHRLYEKYASMGNGSTFVVETLIFLAAARASGSGVTSVYGDDIIVDVNAVPKLIEILTFLGFSVNSEKTHIDGPYRESCGAHWYEGKDVTPVYIREVDERKSVLSHLVNTLASLPGEHMYAYLKSFVARERLQLCPYDGNTNSGVWLHIHDAYAKKLIFAKWSRLYVRHYVPKSVYKHCRDSRALTLWYLRAFVRRFGLQPGEWLETSRYSTDSHKYVLKWVDWIPPVTATPEHLYWWSEYLTH